MLLILQRDSLVLDLKIHIVTFIEIEHTSYHMHSRT